jgi:hypothetical protein
MKIETLKENFCRLKISSKCYLFACAAGVVKVVPDFRKNAFVEFCKNKQNKKHIVLIKAF